MELLLGAGGEEDAARGIDAQRKSPGVVYTGLMMATGAEKYKRVGPSEGTGLASMGAPGAAVLGTILALAGCPSPSPGESDAAGVTDASGSADGAAALDGRDPDPGDASTPADASAPPDLGGSPDSAGPDRNFIWIVGGGGTLLEWNGSAFNAVLPKPSSADLRGVGGSGPRDAWAFGPGELLRWDGGRWQHYATPSERISGVYAPSATEAWFSAAAGRVLHYNRGSITTDLVVASNIDYNAIWGSAANDVWMLGSLGGSAVHWDGGRWNSISGGSGILALAAWGSSTGDVWAVGSSGRIARFTGVWRTVSSSVTTNVWGVSGSGPRDVWAVGDSSVILHWDGSAWSAVQAPVADSFRGVHAVAPDLAWAVGENGSVIRWNGNAWRVFTTYGVSLYGIWGTH